MKLSVTRAVPWMEPPAAAGTTRLPQKRLMPFLVRPRP